MTWVHVSLNVHRTAPVSARSANSLLFVSEVPQFVAPVFRLAAKRTSVEYVPWNTASEYVHICAEMPAWMAFALALRSAVQFAVPTTASTEYTRPLWSPPTMEPHVWVSSVATATVGSGST